MTQDPGRRFRRLSELFDELVDRPAAEREAGIAEACAGDPDLERELRALLAADASGRPDSLISDAIASEAEALDGPDLHGVTLGSWRILKPLGEGGMGTVYLAERADGSYEATAAIKVVRGGLPSPALAERFRSERQIMAGLSHPGVARLLDGGSTDDGTPYLVMEYIQGVPITEWCEARGLDVEERLRLFLAVCDAVAYAHREFVAHRDLKPSNILVTPDGAPKLLDFGIARLVDALAEAESDAPVTTTLGVMTPAYASPEQILGVRTGVSADVYSLGVILYELLSGRLPLDTRGLTSAELVSRITEDVPPLVSVAAAGAEGRKGIGGDLDAIVSRALRKEPDARYASVEALADDVRLHLEGLPIKARRDDWAYRTGKLIRRNRGVVSGTLLLVLLGISFTVNAVLQARALARERDRAEAERATAERVSGFLEELFAEADPNQASAPDPTVRQVLDRGAERVLAGLEADPEVQSTLAMVMGRVYRALGEYDASAPLLDSALSVRRRLAGSDPEDVGSAYLERGALAYDLGDYEAAVDLFEDALEAYRTAAGAGEDSPEVAGALDRISTSLTELGRMDEAEAYERAAVAMYRRIDPEPNADLASVLTSLTDLLRAQGRFDEALTTGEEALTMARAVYGNDHLEVAHALNQHASTLSRSGRPEEAVPFVEEGLAIRRAAFEGPHVEIAASLGNLANILAGLGRLDEALAPRRESAEMIATIFPGDHPYRAASTQSLGDLLARMGRIDEAEPVLLEALEAHRGAFPENHPNVAYPLTSLGRVYRATGRLEASRTMLAEAHRVRSAGLPEGHWHVAASGLELGRTLDELGRADEAEPYLVQAHTILDDTFGPADDRTVEARDALRDHFLGRGMAERAAELAPAGGGSGGGDGGRGPRP